MKKDIKALIEKGKALIEKGKKEKAFKIFKSLIDEDNMEVHYALGYLYSVVEFGNEEPEDPFEEEIKHYKKAFDLAKKNKEDPIAQRVLGYMYERKQNFRQASVWYKKAAENGDAQAQYKLGYLYNWGLVASQEDILAFEKLKKAAKQGDIEAQFNLGQMYRKGVVTGENQKEVFRWLKKAADKGYAPAQTVLGKLAYKQEEKFSWYKKAAKQGFVSAQYLLAGMYLRGDDSFYLKDKEKNSKTIDYQQAFLWLKKAVDQGNYFSHSDLMEMYSEGKGISQDYRQALKSKPKFQNDKTIYQ